MDFSEFLSKKNLSQLPFCLPKNVLSILENLENAGKDFSGILNQLLPSEKENEIFPIETEDPLGAKNYSVTPYFIHQYKNRGLILTTSNCFAYCRYCFRKDYVSCNNSFIDDSSIDEICDYLQKNPQIKELLFSGGDPLVLSDERLDSMISKIKSIRPRMIIRLCSRAIFFNPERITEKFISMIKKYSGIWFIPHINHPFEVDKDFAKNSVDAIQLLLNSGIPIQSQTVLLKNINDDLEILTSLFNSLVELGIKPGYLFQCDLARGISHFRVPIDKACKLYSKLKDELSGLSLPKFAVDLPGGGGKFNLDNCLFVKNNITINQDEEFYFFEKENKIYKYPKN